MDIYNLTINQLRRAVAIKEQIASLNNELRTMFGEPVNSGATPKEKRRMSASARKRIAAAQKARWANFRRKNSAQSARPAGGRKRIMARTVRAKE
jgi:hypothetical protein